MVDGLVFKKSAAHKHMPTHIRNPRLLLLHEVLDHSVSGLSSIRSMEHVGPISIHLFFSSFFNIFSEFTQGNFICFLVSEVLLRYQV